MCQKSEIKECIYCAVNDVCTDRKKCINDEFKYFVSTKQKVECSNLECSCHRNAEIYKCAVLNESAKECSINEKQAAKDIENILEETILAESNRQSEILYSYRVVVQYNTGSCNGRFSSEVLTYPDVNKNNFIEFEEFCFNKLQERVSDNIYSCCVLSWQKL